MEGMEQLTTLSGEMDAPQLINTMHHKSCPAITILYIILYIYNFVIILYRYNLYITIVYIIGTKILVGEAISSNCRKVCIGGR